GKWREPVQQIARSDTFGRNGQRDEAGRRRDRGAHAAGEPDDEVLERSTRESGVGLRDVLAAADALVDPRDRRRTADVLAQELGRARGLLVLVVAGPVGQRIPPQL